MAVQERAPRGRIRKKRPRGWRDRIFVLIGFSLGFAVSAALSSLFTSSMDVGQNSIDSFPRLGCNCSRTSSQQDAVQGEGILDDEEDIEDHDDHGVVNPHELLDLDGKNSKIRDFDPDARVVIVTKIQGKNTVGALNQSLCLLSYAYNHRVNYDIVVFSATEIKKKQLELIRSTVYPANLTFIIDNPGLQTMVDSLDPPQKKSLLKRCKVKRSSELDWLTRCEEKTSTGTSNMHLQYTWQAWFRSIYLWEHPALAKYQYMIWADTDAFCTKRWKQDPISIMRRNDMVILFDNFPMGAARGTEWPYWSRKAFGKPICKIGLSPAGHLQPRSHNCVGKRVSINQIHGFFHMTNLDFYRSEPVMNWQRIMMGDSTFSRFRDDQIAVTVSLLAGRSCNSFLHGDDSIKFYSPGGFCK